MGDPALRAAVQRMDEVLPTADPWPDVLALREAEALHARSLAAGDPSEAAVTAGVLDRLRR